MSIAWVRSRLTQRLAGDLAGNVGFEAMWGAQAVSEIGTQVTNLALPTTAILVLHANALEVGLLTAAQFAPFPLLGLLAGVYVDRAPRRRILIVCDLVRVAAIGSIPVAFLFGQLRIEQLYMVGIVGGCASLFFLTASQSLLPGIVERDRLLQANSRFEATRSIATFVGPATAGVLIQRLGAPVALFVDAASFLWSAAFLRLVHERPLGTRPHRAFGHELLDGLRYLFAMPIVWRVSVAAGMSNLGLNIAYAVQLIFVYRVLHLQPATVGLLLAVSSAGSIAGALAAPRLSRGLGVGRTIFVSMMAISAPMFAVSLVAGPLAPVELLVAWTLLAAGYPIFNANSVSIRQSLTPADMIGRVNAGVRTMSWGSIPVGAALGGIIGSHIGLRPTLVVGAIVATTALVPLLGRPLRFRELGPAA